MGVHFQTIDEYIKAYPEDIQLILDKIRRIIREAAPRATETISYEVPTFDVNGKHLIFFAAWKDHISLYPIPAGDNAVQKAMAPYLQGRGTLRFPLNQPIPYDLIGRIVAMRVAERSSDGKTKPGGEDAMKVKQRLTPFLWFDGQAEQAANYYVSVFADSRMGRITGATDAGSETTGLREGMVLFAEFEIAGMKFGALNGGPQFKFNPSISLLVSCSDKEEVDALWTKLSQGGGPPLMGLGSYPFSERYGWTQDRYGLSWQVMLVRDGEIKQKITPTLMYAGRQSGKAEDAVNLYTAVFPNSAVDHMMRYGKGEEPDKEGTVRHAGFTLQGTNFAAMDSAGPHNFQFNEAISFLVECQTQKEIDYYWDKLTADGGQESYCGWLKDRFGVSWQVLPAVLDKMMRDPDRKKAARVTEAYLKMKKFNISAIRKAYKGT